MSQSWNLSVPLPSAPPGDKDKGAPVRLAAFPGFTLYLQATAGLWILEVFTDDEPARKAKKK